MQCHSIGRPGARSICALPALAGTMVPASVLIALLLGRNSEYVLLVAVAVNAIGAVLQATIFRAWWQRHQPAHRA